MVPWAIRVLGRAVFALYNTQGCCRARNYTVFHSSMMHTRAVNISVNIRSEIIKLSAHTRGRTSDHQRPTGGSLASRPPPVWLGSTARPTPARSEPPPGLKGLPARGCCLLARTPETAPAGGASSAAARRPCTLRPAAGASPARGPRWPTRQGRRRRLARPCGALQQPRWPGRPGHCGGYLGSGRQPPRGSLAAA